MDDISAQKKTLLQKKQRLTQQETILKIKERKARTRALIEIGGLSVKAKIDHLPSDVLLGAFVSLKNAIDTNPTILADWKNSGAAIFSADTKEKIPIIVKLPQKPNANIRTYLRKTGLKWNNLRQEWYGYTNDLNLLKQNLASVDAQFIAV